MKNCIFCQIAEDPSTESYRIIYSDKNYLAMLVSHPENQGHFIVFPRNHFSEMSELSNPGDLFKSVINLAEEKTKKLKAKAYTVKLNNNLYKLEENNPLHVGHIHMHVVPRYSKDEAKMFSPTKAARVSLEKLRNILA